MDEHYLTLVVVVDGKTFRVRIEFDFLKALAERFVRSGKDGRFPIEVEDITSSKR